MADRTGIEWTDATWNPIVGCSLVSPGCANCYAMRYARRIASASDDSSPYFGTTGRVNRQPVWNGKVAQAGQETLLAPLRWKKPRRIFVNSMGDLFHESVPDLWIDQVFAVMALAPQHSFQVLTKRSARMREYLSDPKAPRRIYEFACDFALLHEVDVVLVAPGIDPTSAPPGPRIFLDAWPLPNVWLGISAENQPRADERIPDLLETPAAVRFVSYEPALGPIDFTRVSRNGLGLRGDALRWPAMSGPSRSFGARLDWIICGGESGHGARPMHPDWARSARDQCAAAGVAFFFKQWGEWAPPKPQAGGDLGADTRAGRVQIVHPSARDAVEILHESGNTRQAEKGSRYMARVGRRAAGRLLDGLEHNAMPGETI
jgi:protein gp37